MFRSCTGLNTRGLYPTHDPYVSKPIPLCTGTGSDGYGHGLPRKTPGQPVPFPTSIPAHAPSQKRSALPPGAVLTFRRSRSRSPERHGTLQVREVSSFDRVVYRSLLNGLKQLIQKVRVVGRQDPRQALQLEELEAQASKSELPE